MKNNTQIKGKDLYSRKNIILSIVFVVISLLLGVIISELGKGTSYIETELFTAIITLFGFGLTATVFIYQAFDEKDGKISNVLAALTSTLKLTLILIVAAICLDFIASLVVAQNALLIISTMKYAALIYSLICQFDILNAFVILIKFHKSNHIEK